MIWQNSLPLNNWQYFFSSYFLYKNYIKYSLKFYTLKKKTTKLGEGSGPITKKMLCCLCTIFFSGRTYKVRVLPPPPPTSVFPIFSHSHYVVVFKASFFCTFCCLVYEVYVAYTNTISGIITYIQSNFNKVFKYVYIYMYYLL